MQNVVSRVVSLPLVSTTYDMVSSAYANTKDKHPYLKTVCEMAEKGVKTITAVALTSAMPIIQKLEPQSKAWLCVSVGGGFVKADELGVCSGGRGDEGVMLESGGNVKGMFVTVMCVSSSCNNWAIVFAWCCNTSQVVIRCVYVHVLFFGGRGLGFFFLMGSW